MSHPSWCRSISARHWLRLGSRNVASDSLSHGKGCAEREGQRERKRCPEGLPFGAWGSGGCVVPGKAKRVPTQRRNPFADYTKRREPLLVFRRVNKLACAASAIRRASLAAVRSRVSRSPSKLVSEKSEKASAANENSNCGIGKRRLCRFMVILQSSGLLVGGKVRTINLAWVASDAGGKPPARVLPNLPPPVPMETKLCEVRSNSRVLPVVKLNPNPSPHDFGQFPKTRCFVI